MSQASESPPAVVGPSHCEICKRHFDPADLVPFELIRPGLYELMAREHPAIQDDGVVCLDDLNAYRKRYTAKLLEEEKGEITALEKEVLESLHESDLLASNLNEMLNRRRTFGEALSDRMANFGGSWAFILTFLGILVVWIATNAVLRKPFDPYPFILLNLLLSCVAALQAPVIMMSQNRQEERDRLRAEEDYKINLKAELEIRTLIAKIDQLRQHQWRRLLELQNIQLDLMNELHRNRVRHGHGGPSEG